MPHVCPDLKFAKKGLLHFPIGWPFSSRGFFVFRKEIDLGLVHAHTHAHAHAHAHVHAPVHGHFHEHLREHEHKCEHGYEHVLYINLNMYLKRYMYMLKYIYMAVTSHV
jgi:hypothetical protein